ncbi:MAG: prephenate dehydratase domain-containing protein [Thermodesulfobacteriota bacterium]
MEHPPFVIAVQGPEGSQAWQAARTYRPDAAIHTYPSVAAALAAFVRGEACLAVVPVYNTRSGELKDHFRLLKDMERGFWVDNVVLPIDLSLGSLVLDCPLRVLISEAPVFRQCEEYISASFPDVTLMAVDNLDAAVAAVRASQATDQGVIDREERLRAQGLKIRARELAPHNKTRFAIVGHQLPARTGYDATAMITAPLKDRVGLLYDILGEFARRGVNLLDMRSETDVLTQKLSFYIEAEGHVADEAVRSAVTRIESQIIQEPGAIRLLGSYPRVDMRAKLIRGVGFIGSGDMSRWFAERLTNEGYTTLLTGRASAVRPEAMIGQVEVVAVCVPISVTRETVRRFGPLLRAGQALILLAGEAEHTLSEALACTEEGVEVMLIHNLWGPSTATMKDKNVVVVRTERSGPLCSELEAFLYKHGAVISRDQAVQHDLMMGVTQKLPTAISVALGIALAANGIDPQAIGRHATLTSLYGLLAMARVHVQNPRTYAEILATAGQGGKIARDFAQALDQVLSLAEVGDLAGLAALITNNRSYLGEPFLAQFMGQAKAVDETLGQALTL